MKKKAFVFLPLKINKKNDLEKKQNFTIFNNIIKPVLQNSNYEITLSEFTENRNETTVHIVVEICKSTITIIDLTDPNTLSLYEKIVKKFTHKYFIILVHKDSDLEIKNSFHRKIIFNPLLENKLSLKSKISEEIESIESEENFNTNNEAFIMINLNKVISSTNAFEMISNSIFQNDNNMSNVELTPEIIKKILKDYFKRSIVKHYLRNHNKKEDKKIEYDLQYHNLENEHEQVQSNITGAISSKHHHKLILSTIYNEASKSYLEKLEKQQHNNNIHNELSREK